MTAQEAIERIKYRIETASLIAGKGVDGKAFEDLDMAIETLEKQIPKRPYFEADGYWDGQLVYDTWICPYCEKHYEVDYDDYEFCPNCGQKLDWSEEE